MIYWILHIAFIGALSFLFYRKFRLDFSPLIFWGALSLKLLAGIILGLIYYHYYEDGDTIAFHRQAVEMSRLPFSEFFSSLFQWSSYENSQHPRVLFFTKLLSIFAFVSGGSYWISSLYLSFISFCASWYALNIFYQRYTALKSILIACFLFVPSIVFWSSGIIKESIACSALLVLVASFLKVHSKLKPRLLEWLLTILSIYILWKLKHYLLITFLIFISLTWTFGFLTSSRKKRKWLLVPLIIAVLFSTQWIHPYLTFERLPQTIFENNQAIIQKSADRGSVNVIIESPDWPSVLKAVPNGLLTGLFRPTILDATHIWGWIHRVENSGLIILGILSMVLLFKPGKRLDLRLALPALVSICMLTTLLALSTPNFGTLVRYKSAIMPFFLLLCSILPYQHFLQKPPDNR